MDVDVQALDFREDVAVDQQQVLPTVVVEIEEATPPSDEASVARETCCESSLFKLALRASPIEALALIGKVGTEYIDQPVAVIICCCHAHAGERLAVLVQRNATQHAFLFESAVSLIAVTQ